MTDYKVSVIIPVYGVQNFIERCALSLFNQTMKEIEYIFVNDATPDKSIEILKKVILQYPERKVIVIDHSENKGLPAARNTGLKLAIGKYIFHCDSDDYVEPDMLEQLYDGAVDKDADIVWCDWFLSFNKNERYMREPLYLSVQEAIVGMLSGAMKYNVWNKLVKRSLYIDNNICFPNGYAMGEDMTMIRLMGCAKKITYVSGAFYHYVRINMNAYTQCVNMKALKDLRYNVSETLHFVETHFPDSFINELNYFKLNVKLPFLISEDSTQYQLWENWYPEANQFIFSNKNLPVYTRLLQWMAWHKQYWFVKLYYRAIIRFRYGIIYK